MLTNKEKRFIKYWEEQRTGGKWKYYLLYMLTGTFISTLILSFVAVMIMPGRHVNFFYIAATSFLLVTIITVVSWRVNEKKFRQIIRREISDGRSREASDTP